MGRLLLPYIPGGWWTVGGVGALLLLPITLLVRGFSGIQAPGPRTRVWILRPFWYCMLFLPILVLAGALGSMLGWLFGDATAGGRTLLLGVAGLLAIGALWGYWGSRRLVVRHLEAGFADLPRAFDGLRLVQLSDLHVGPHTSKHHLSRVVSAVQEAAPDLLVYTGDQVDDYEVDMGHFREAFGDLTAPLGVFAVLGNHDIFAGWAGVCRRHQEMGIEILVNEARLVEREGERICLVGTGDPAASHWPLGGRTAAPDLEASLAAVPDGAFTIALAHNPALWAGLGAAGVQLTLSGHTHHGQVSIPKLGWCLASPFVPFAMGRHQRGEAWLYIHPGTNFWGLPLRIGAWPEVAILTLRRLEPGHPSSLREISSPVEPRPSSA